MKIDRINDWRVVEREDGSVFIESGNPRGRHHLAFDVDCEKHIAQLFCSAANSQGAAIEQAVKETAEECARICVEETDVQHCGSGYMREEWGVGTLSEAAREIRSAFGIAEVKRDPAQRFPEWRGTFEIFNWLVAKGE